MKDIRSAILFSMAFWITSLGFAQNITDVEVKTYGSYAGGSIDTVDLATGNLFLNIPLISYPQLGNLPPLTFGIGLNNAPYGIELVCDPDHPSECGYTPEPYDPSPPGSSTPRGIGTSAGIAGISSDAKLGAYMTSSFEGGLVMGQTYYYPRENDQITGYVGGITYSLIDANGNSHELNSDIISWNTYRAMDGTGYTFMPSFASTNSDGTPGNAYGSTNLSNLGVGCYGPPVYTTGPPAYALFMPSWNYWLGQDCMSGDMGVRAGTIYSPTGIKYMNQFQSEDTLPLLSNNSSSRLVFTTESDASGQNSITRGPWNWTGSSVINYSNPAERISTFYGQPGSTNYPYYTDSINRKIPDIISLQESVLGQTGQVSSLCPILGTLQLPQPNPVASLAWNVPGPGGAPLQYLICYVKLNITGDWAQNDPIGGTYPATSLWETGYAIQSILLPDQKSYWGFAYDQASALSECAGSAHCGSGDLLELMLPTGGSIFYTYANVAVSQNRCGTNGVLWECHAVVSRKEVDGLGGSSTTTYSYGPSSVSYPLPSTFTTTETPQSGNAILHTFTLQGNQYTGQLFETGTNYYQDTPDTSGNCASPKCLKSVSTIFNNTTNPLWDIPEVTNMWPGPGSGLTCDGQPCDFGGSGTSYRITNTLPTQITTINPANGAQVINNRSYSPLFTAVGIVCSNDIVGAFIPNSCTTSSINLPGNNAYTGLNYSVPISFVSPTTEQTSGPNGILKTTQSSYEFGISADVAYQNGTAVALPVSVENTDSMGQTIYAKTIYGYDSVRFGYLDSVSRSLSSTGQFNWSTSVPRVTTSTTYNTLNEPYLLTDPQGNQTKITGPNGQSGFMDQCISGAAAYPQVVTKAFGSTTTLPETTNYVYDCYIGAMTSVTDPNSVTTSYNYLSDPLGRLTQVKYGLGNSPLLNQSTPLSTATLSYPTITTLNVAQDQITLNDRLINGSTLYDGLGRTIQQTSPAGYTVTTTYNSDGQVASLTNPQGTDSVYGTSSSSGGTDGTIYYYYDPLGRVIKETEQDSNTLWWCYNGIQDSAHPQPNDSRGNPICSSSPYSTISGAVSWVDSTDEAGNHHQQVSNALGQLIASIEPNPFYTETALTLETDYSYDPNGNLTNVSQLGTTAETARIRTFKYDTLSRLLWSKNPETGVICYGHGDGTIGGCQADGYDPNGNLLYKTDASGITTSYTYDGLNRLLSKSGSSGAPWSCYQYNSTTAYGIGRLGSQWTQNGGCSQPLGAGDPTRTIISAYDAMGRVKSEQQCVFSSCSTDYPSQSTYNYDLAGDLTQYSDGLGTRYFAKQYDNASRLQTMTVGPTPFTLFSAQSYSVNGGLTRAFYGGITQNAAALIQNRTYDSHLRVTGETDGQN